MKQDEKRELLRMLSDVTGWINRDRGFKEPQEPAEVKRARQIVKRFDRKVSNARDSHRKRHDRRVSKAREAIYFSTAKQALAAIKSLRHR